MVGLLAAEKQCCVIYMQLNCIASKAGGSTLSCAKGAEQHYGLLGARLLLLVYWKLKQY